MHDWVLWVLAVASALHVVEEHALGWQGWAAGSLGRRLGMVPTWMDFWPTNGFLIVFAIAAAAVGWRAPGFALALPAGLLINAVLFHVVPSIAARRPNPGCFTAVALYLPIGVWAYVAALPGPPSAPPAPRSPHRFRSRLGSEGKEPAQIRHESGLRRSDWVDGRGDRPA